MDAPEFNVFKPFMYMANEIQAVNPMFYYYIKTYAVQKAHAIYKQMNPNHPSYKVLGNNLNQWITELNQMKNSNPQMFADKEQNRAEITNFALKLFFETDTQERDGEVSKDLVRNFQVCFRYFETLTYFGQLDKDIDEKRKYSKAKSVELTKKLKNPELYQKPKEDDIDDFDKQMQAIQIKVEQEPKGNVPNQYNPPVNQQQPKMASTYQPAPVQNTPYQPQQSVFNQIPKFIPKQGTQQSNYQGTNTGDQGKQHCFLFQKAPNQYNYPMQQQSQPQQPQQQPQPQQPYPQPQYQPQMPSHAQYPDNYQQKAQQQQNYPQSQPTQQPTIQPNTYQPQQQNPQQKQDLSTLKLSSVQIAEKRTQAKKLLENAISELDFKKYGKAKENLLQAIQLISMLEQ